ncbi:TetR/AcrR family transcriptional regulator [Streptomyces spectabilis]|uniref:AcrR family transcriptional regulator n=1 Tax=Streptomyces spectabilis TaxID=68270 RepID=A0A5P2X5I0_STRST|nr:TetR/AcrR family transcriptional regulator [Streptomyces spectabilis]MBB5107341.1 AcrR family transcriptional regulator [Streptomyces spectabilis]MCI3900032.1 TetR/AcrR family transcriptional regulator [Streptomyces spectabilis]QEV57662.1 TetR/AcrR family transcriptional regulator [Streptomyces spectabilis]GGV36955.1 TetR family transcriptional regulator [Streptomyces spectabilis]
MTSDDNKPKRTTYRHGDLRNALIKAGVELAREGGPEAVVLRAATRQAGVAPNAAYRHFTDRGALLHAVSQAAMAQVAHAIEAELAAVADGLDEKATARARFRAVGTGYLRFAQEEPGLFRIAFHVPGDMTHASDADAAGAGGKSPFDLLGTALDELVETGQLPEDRRPGAEFLAWSAVHGLAVLVIDGPLRGLHPTQARDAGQHLIDMIERGI